MKHLLFSLLINYDFLKNLHRKLFRTVMNILESRPREESTVLGVNKIPSKHNSHLMFCSKDKSSSGVIIFKQTVTR